MDKLRWTVFGFKCETDKWAQISGDNLIFFVRIVPKDTQETVQQKINTLIKILEQLKPDVIVPVELESE